MPQLVYCAAAGLVVSIGALVILLLNKNTHRASLSKRLYISGAIGSVVARYVTSSPVVPFAEELLLSYTIAGVVGLLAGAIVYSMYWFLVRRS